jgi:hypothetical protein
MNRYLDTGVFESLVRPQYPSSCSIASITSAVRYLSCRDIRQKDVADTLGVNIEGGRLNPGNRTVAKWLGEVARHYKLVIAVTVLFQGGWERTSGDNDQNWMATKEFLLAPDTFLILHIEGHYTPILGFAAFPKSPTGAGRHADRWLFVADPSPFHRQTRIPAQHLRKSPPIWSLRWGALRKAFSEHSKYGIICASKC